MTKKKKIIILSCMIALLAITAVFNFVLTTQPALNDGEISTVSASSYFSQYRTERLTTRSEELLQLDQIITASNEDTKERADALAMKIELTQMTETELMLESLIKAYGFSDAVVIMGLESGNVNVVAKSADLQTDEAIMIYTLISEEISISPENVKIIPIS